MGLGQVRLSTAQWLAGVKGYSCYGSAPSVAALQSAPTSLYFAAAHLRELAASCACSLRGDDIAQAHDTSLGQAGCQQGGKEEHHEERLVKAYYSSRHKGCEPGGCEEEAEQCWQLYRRTKAQLAVLADALARSQAVPGGTAEPPVMMHVVRPGESLASLAAVCGVSVASILEANPDIGDGQLEANDCIALPVSQVLPSFRMVLPTDTLYSIAADHRCGLQRLLRHNPDMKDPQRFVPGALLALPGLRGSSMDYDADSSSQLDVGLDAPALLMMLAAARSQAAEPLAQSPLPLVTPIAVH